MAIVYYRFKSNKDFHSLPVESNFISLYDLKQRLFQSNKLGRCRGSFDIMVANHQTNQDYTDEATLIPKHTSLLLRRVPLSRCNPIVLAKKQKPVQQRSSCTVSVIKEEKTATSPANTTILLLLLPPPCTHHLPLPPVVFNGIATINKSKCACGATNLHVVPNLTIRNLINRILEEALQRAHSQGTRSTFSDVNLNLLEGLQQRSTSDDEPEKKRRKLFSPLKTVEVL